METSSAYPPLTPVAKVKVSLLFIRFYHWKCFCDFLGFYTLQIIKKSQFTLKRRKGKPDEFDSDDWVCPPFDSSDLDNDKTSPPKVIGHL
jgi:hypothetical protein